MCLDAQGRFTLKEGKPPAARRQRELHEFFVYYGEAFRRFIDFAIVDSTLPPKPAGRIPTDADLATFVPSDHIAYFRLYRRQSDGNLSLEFGIYDGIFGRFDDLKKLLILKKVLNNERVAMWRQGSQRRAQDLSMQRPTSESLGVITIAFQVVDDDGRVTGELSFSQYISKHLVSSTLAELGTRGVESGVLSAWIVWLSFQVQAGLSKRYFTLKDGGSRSAMGHMARTMKESNGKLRWTWKELSSEEAAALMREYTASQESSDIISLVFSGGRNA